MAKSGGGDEAEGLITGRSGQGLRVDQGQVDLVILALGKVADQVAGGVSGAAFKIGGQDEVIGPQAPHQQVAPDAARKAVIAVKAAQSVIVAAKAADQAVSPRSAQQQIGPKAAVQRGPVGAGLQAVIAKRFSRPDANVKVDTFSGLLADYAIEQNAQAVVRGIRAISDYEYEQQIALMNRRLAPNVETVFLMSAQEYSYLSSRLVKEVFSFGGNIDGLVPPIAIEKMRADRVV